MRGNGVDGAQAKRKAANTGSKTAEESHEKAPIKRQRVSRACDQCRAAREKCDGIQPVCFTCASSNRDCSYTTNPKKRGIQPGYIRTLELALAWVFSNVAGSEAALNTMLTAESGQGSSLLVGKDTAESDKLHKKWRRSTVCKEVERLLSGSDTIENDRLSPNTPDPDPELSSRLQPQLRANHPPTPHSPSIARNQHPRPPEERLPLPLHPSDWLVKPWEQETTPGYGQTSTGNNNPIGNDPRSLPVSPSEVAKGPKLMLPSNIWRLFDIYFAYSQSWLPITEKHDLLKLSYSYPEDGLEISLLVPGSGKHAELWGALALSSMQEASNVNGLPSQDETTPRSPEDLYDAARSLIPNEDATFELGHVKALLLLALFNLGYNKPEIAWLQVGHASRLLLCLERRLGHSRVKSALDSRLNHVFAGCFVLDTIISGQYGQSAYLRSSDIERRGPIDEEGLEEWHPWVGCEGFGAKKDPLAPSMRSPVHSLSVFNSLVKLMSLYEISQSPGKDLPPTSMESASRLESWATSLPRTCSFVRDGNIPAASTPPTILLRLSYLFATSISDPSQVRPTDDFIDLLEHLADTFGLATVPPIIFSLIAVLVNHQGFDLLTTRSKTRIRSFETTYVKALSPIRGNTQSRRISYIASRSLNDSREGPISASQSSAIGNFQLPTPESTHATFQPAAAPSMSTRNHERPMSQPALFHDILPDMSPSASLHAKAASFAAPQQQQLGSINSSHFHPVYPEIVVDSYNTEASLDLDAFFDELASLDGPENRENQPQFMQNLGFASDADLTDVLASDYGQFDPLLSAFLNPSVAGQSSIDQSRPFDGG